MTLTLISWNVNGLRACYDRKHFLPVFRHNPGIVCVQETKAPAEKLPEKVRDLYGYHTYFFRGPAGKHRRGRALNPGKTGIRRIRFWRSGV